MLSAEANLHPGRLDYWLPDSSCGRPRFRFPSFPSVFQWRAVGETLPGSLLVTWRNARLAQIWPIPPVSPYNKKWERADDVHRGICSSWRRLDIRLFGSPIDGWSHEPELPCQILYFPSPVCDNSVSVREKKTKLLFCIAGAKLWTYSHLFMILLLLRIPGWDKCRHQSSHPSPTRRQAAREYPPHQNLQLDLQHPQAHASPLVSASSPRQSRTGPTSATCRSSTRFPTRSRSLSVHAARSPAQARGASWDSGKARWRCSSQLEVRRSRGSLRWFQCFSFCFCSVCSGFINFIHLTWNLPSVPLLLQDHSHWHHRLAETNQRKHR